MEETKDFIKDDFRLFELFTEVAHFVVTEELVFKEEQNKELEI